MDPACCDSTVQVCFPGARAAVLDNLNRQREEGRLCDLSIQVQGQVFRAHRCVLAASSPYFHDQVLLKNVTTVSLPSVLDPVAFESVLTSAYTGQLSIVHDDIVHYVTVASFLQMWHIVDKCTEMLKGPRPSVDGGSAAQPASRQQSPSSTETLYVEREGRRRDRRPDALPPLATWRRPQQLGRWARPRASSAQHMADSQLDGTQGYVESGFSGCEEVLASNHTVGPSMNSRLPGGGAGEASKPKGRCQQRVGQLTAERMPEKESEESQNGKKIDRMETEADEGVGEESEARREALSPCEVHAVCRGQGEGGHATGRHRSDPPSDPGGVHCSGTGEGAPGPEAPVSARLQWQMETWSEQDGGAGNCCKDENEEEEDFDGFTSGGNTRDAYNDITQRALLPVSPEFVSKATWPSTGGAQSGSVTPTSSQQQSTSSAGFPPPPSPPTPSSSSSVSLASPTYSGKVHFCHCGKAYTLKSMRDRHVKMQHLNLRPFGCPVCSKSFKMKHHLTKHLKTHGGVRPYECTLCGKKVVWRDSFLRHQARCGGLPPDRDTDNSYTCGFSEGGAFLPTGHVKVEEVDFHREVEDGMGRLLDNMSGIVNELSAPPQSVDTNVLKEEVTEGFSGS
ncbi:zinc finger and BTB domain-containing protein 22 [Oryzias melastigma]|uniref:Zinc finger and BTB domain containing 22a n=1 Tax=Oryzias melastigma TaxID=30732 RepID=A0A3B3CPS3_ORYME|nr:zinc finger and BTB domain-containing protein 22 [Oryzias melastigma]XP_024151578.1 zinc finger and BTB domain-containing protein 22 [Oryzias melastigma]XP_036070112.1 zinc finger and BTB domain-containing protein 22 [Oryzias melastigma]